MHLMSTAQVSYGKDYASTVHITSVCLSLVNCDIAKVERERGLRV